MKNDSQIPTELKINADSSYLCFWHLFVFIILNLKPFESSEFAVANSFFFPRKYFHLGNEIQVEKDELRSVCYPNK